MKRRDFVEAPLDRAGALFRIGVSVANNRDLTSGQRQVNGFSDQMAELFRGCTELIVV